MVTNENGGYKVRRFGSSERLLAQIFNMFCAFKQLVPSHICIQILDIFSRELAQRGEVDHFLIVATYSHDRSPR
jgi:hypothetical protein